MRIAVTTFAIALGLAAGATATASANTARSCTVHRSGWNGYVTVSRHTSCPFARRVAVKAMRNIMRWGPGRFDIYVYSPVTRRHYWMACRARGEVYSNAGTRASCSGGIGAYVAWTAWRS